MRMDPFGRKKTAKREQILDFAEISKATHSDTDGSYTGSPLYDETPVQDADDL
jgi:hypothetical protein